MFLFIIRDRTIILQLLPVLNGKILLVKLEFHESIVRGLVLRNDLLQNHACDIARFSNVKKPTKYEPARVFD